MNEVLAKFLFNVALMIAGYFFVCSAISYAIDYYFKAKEVNDQDERIEEH